MSLLDEIIFPDNPSIWHDFGGTSSGYAGITWQMMIWSIIVGVLVFVWMTYNLIMFKHKEGDPEHKDALKVGVFPHERGDPRIEIAWTIAPLILVIWLTYISLAPLNYLWDVPDEEETDLVVEVVAGQWYWSFSYEDNYVVPSNFDKCSTNVNCVEIPHGSIIRFNINALDVLHAFYIVEIVVKQDAVPGIETLAWVDTSDVSPGEYNIYCAEYCGNSHSEMLAKLYITVAE
jgi:cytochrome c oxidase subunit 2